MSEVPKIDVQDMEDLMHNVQQHGPLEAIFAAATFVARLCELRLRVKERKYVGTTYTLPVLHYELMQMQLSSTAVFCMSLPAFSHGMWMLREATHAAHVGSDDPLSEDERRSLEGFAFMKGERERKKGSIISAWKGFPQRDGIRLEIFHLVSEHRGQHISNGKDEKTAEKFDLGQIMKIIRIWKLRLSKYMFALNCPANFKSGYYQLLTPEQVAHMKALFDLVTCRSILCISDREKEDLLSENSPLAPGVNFDDSDKWLSGVSSASRRSSTNNSMDISIDSSFDANSLPVPVPVLLADSGTGASSTINSSSSSSSTGTAADTSTSSGLNSRTQHEYNMFVHDLHGHFTSDASLEAEKETPSMYVSYMMSYRSCPLGIPC